MDISIGRDSITRKEFFIDSTKHINIEGMSGMGKSTLLVNLFIEHIRQGNGGLFIDPHGDTADQIAKLIPKSRMRDFIWIDPDASLVPPFNPLHFSGDTETKNISLNRATINGLVDEFGEDSEQWLTAETEKVVVGGKRQTALYLVADGYEKTEG